MKNEHVADALVFDNRAPGSAPMDPNFIINVDIDDVQAAFIPAFYDFVRERGINPPAPRPPEWDFVRSGWFDTKGDFHRAMSDFARERRYRSILPVDGVIEGMRDLAKIGRVRGITARGTHVDASGKLSNTNVFERLDSIEWLAEHGIVLDELVFTNSKTDYHCHVAIEDAPTHLSRYIDNGIPVVVVDHPHNSRITENIVTRSFGWDDTVAAVRHVFAESR